MSKHHEEHPEYAELGIFAGYMEFEDGCRGLKADGVPCMWISNDPQLHETLLSGTPQVKS